MKNHVTLISEHITHDQKNTHKELKKTDYKALFIIHQCVDLNSGCIGIILILLTVMGFKLI